VGWGGDVREEVEYLNIQMRRRFDRFYPF